MKKSLMSNIKHFVDSNVRQRIDRATGGAVGAPDAALNEHLGGDYLSVVERQFEHIRQVCLEIERRMAAMLPSLQASSSLAASGTVSAIGAYYSSTAMATGGAGHSEELKFKAPPMAPEMSSSSADNLDQPTWETLISTTNNSLSPTELQRQEQSLSGVELKRHKKLPVVGFLKFLNKTCHNSPREDSPLTMTLKHCSRLQTQLTKLYFTYEKTVEQHCLKPIQQIIEVDVPNVIKLRKLSIRALNDLESARAKYNGASQKQQQQQSQQQLHTAPTYSTSTSYTVAQQSASSSAQQANINKLDLLKKELDEALARFEQARDSYAIELYAFVCRERELVNLLAQFYQYQAEYSQQVSLTIFNSLPALNNTSGFTARKAVFGTPLDEHLQSTGQPISLVIAICVHILYSNALDEEGLFRVPGSSLKIKKLKNAINAWFVVVADADESDNDQQPITHKTLSNGKSFSKQSLSASTLAIYDLFKDIVGQKSELNAQTQSLSNHNSVTLITHPAVLTSRCNLTNHDDLNSPVAAADNPTLTTASHTASTSHTSETTPASPPHKYNQQADNRQTISFDVHTIAGLLKLYLRELPEPLFTYAHYDQWIEAATQIARQRQHRQQPSQEESELEKFKDIIRKLPKSNYDNLQLLIKFLHHLTTHSETNKMTASNLAITMAPSLIWPPPKVTTGIERSFVSANQNSCTNQLQPGSQDLQDYNMQISNFGMLASMHALVLENLIINAELLFPEPISLRLASLDKVEEASERRATQALSTTQSERCIKSTSPTGLSTASSSSFSSNSNASTSTNTTGKAHSRKGGSMDGLLNTSNEQDSGIPFEFSGTLKNRQERPKSICVRNIEAQGASPLRTQPPPIPPIPATRLHHVRHLADAGGSDSQIRLSKSLATPVMSRPGISLSDYTDKSSSPCKRNEHLPYNDSSRAPVVQPVSLRGTGSIPSKSCNSQMRPSVPPPSRPPRPLDLRLAHNNNNSSTAPNEMNSRELSERDTGSQTGGSKSHISSIYAGGGRNVCATEEMCTDSQAASRTISTRGTTSPDVSLPNSVSDNEACAVDEDEDDFDDSSFDNDNQSSEQSSDQFPLAEFHQQELNSSAPATSIELSPSLTKCAEQQSPPATQSNLNVSFAEPAAEIGAPGLAPAVTVDELPLAAATSEPENSSESKTMEQERHVRTIARSEPSKPPIKPPRSNSPKITQTTPL